MDLFLGQKLHKEFRMHPLRPFLRYAVPLSALLTLLVFGLLNRHRAYAFLPNVDPITSLPALEAERPPGARVVEMEGLKMGETFGFSHETGVDDDAFQALLLSELRDRFAITLRDASSPCYTECSVDNKRYEVLRQGSRDSSSQTISIAINLHNSQGILPAQSTAILQALAYLLPNYRVYVSLFENGSNDLTRELLSDFAAALDALGADGIWMHSSRFLTSGKEDRMSMLSEIRNHALRPLMPYAGSGTLVFMNDVATCPEDILELVYQRQIQGSDVIIGTDWITMKNGKTTLYDLWATRGINGELPFFMEGDSGLRPVSTNGDNWMLDYWITQHMSIRQRWLDGLPLPVYSGWGGMAAFDATLFTVEGLRFRSSRPAGWEGGTGSGSMGRWGQLMHDAEYLDGDCPGDSECKLIFRDIWNIRNGKAKIALAPRTRTVYDVKHWAAMRDLAAMWPRRTDNPILKAADSPAVGDIDERIDWSRVEAPKGVVCIASRTKEGVPVPAWGDANIRVRLNPILGKAVASTDRKRRRRK